MTAAPALPRAVFWDGQPARVRAVLDLAYAREDLTPDVHTRILDTLAPEHADAIMQIADDLYWAERLRTDHPGTVLSAYHDAPVHGPFLADAAERLAEEHEQSALTCAQLVASLLQAGAR